MKSNNKINVLIIGAGMYVCGRGTQSYGTVLPAIMKAYKNGLLDKVLIATSSPESLIEFDQRVKKLQKLIGVNINYIGYPKQKRDKSAYIKAIEDLPNPGAVIIVTPDHLHTEMALQAIEQKKHVLVVKPLAPTVNEVYKLIDAANKQNIYGAVEFHKRWDLANLKILSELAAGTIGDPLYFHVEFSQRKIIPQKFFRSWVSETNIFQYLGVHYVDIIYFITKALPLRVLAIGQSRWLIKHGINTYDSIQVLIEWSEGFTSSLLVNWIDPNCNSALSQQLIKVVGTKGRIESNQTERGFRLTTDEKGERQINPYFCQPFLDFEDNHISYSGYGIDSIFQFLKDVLDISTGQKSPADLNGKRPTFREALVSTAVLEAARISLEKKNMWIYFDDRLRPV